MSRPLSDSEIMNVHNIHADSRVYNLFFAKVRQQRLIAELKRQQSETFQFFTQQLSGHPIPEEERLALLALATISEGELIAAGLGQSVRNARRGMNSIALLAKLYQSKQ